MEYLPDSRSFLLEDGQSLGAILELQPVGTEARDDKFMTSLRDAIQVALTDAIPEHETSPWVLQLFVQDQHDLSELDRKLGEYGTPKALDSAYNRFFQNEFSQHIKRITAPGGMYEDKAVTGARWRGQIRSVRAILYQRWSPQDLKKGKLEDAEQTLEDTLSRFSAALAVTGVTFRRGTHEEFYRWLFPWFNPKPDTGLDSLSTLENLGITDNPEELPFGHDFSESLVLSVPNSVAKVGVWWFDGLPHTFVSMQTLRQIPPIGGLTAERTSGNNTFALFDQFPEHTIMSMTITVKSQTSVRNHVGRIRRAAVGDTADAELTREDADAVERQIARGNKLYPMSLGFYVRGEDLADLEQKRDCHSRVALVEWNPVDRSRKRSLSIGQLRTQSTHGLRPAFGRYSSKIQTGLLETRCQLASGLWSQQRNRSQRSGLLQSWCGTDRFRPVASR